MTLTDALLLVVLGSLGYLIFWPKKSLGDIGRMREENLRLEDEVERKNQEVGELKQECSNIKKEKDELSGKNKQIFVELTSLKADHKNVVQERNELGKKVAEHEIEEKRRGEVFKDEVSQLQQAKEKFEGEQRRIQKEDEAMRKAKEEQRDRMWAEHEINVQSRLVELCRLPEYSFPFYDNKNLPDILKGGKFKPDFLVEFLEQYVIFDAKVSRSDKLQNYVTKVVKDTVEKINDHPRIYPVVFLVVPTEAISVLSRTHFYEQKYEFFVISSEAIPVVLSTLKRVAAYELADQMDPLDRENIVGLIAAFDHHINFRNTLGILAAQSGVNVLSKTQYLAEDLKKDIDLKKSQMRFPQFSSTDINTLMIGTEIQEGKIEELTAPKASIPKSQLSAVKKPLFGE